MIKQDNRPPKSDTFDRLKDLLNDNTAPVQNEEPKIENDKVVVISVNGNNNVITMEKSKYTSKKSGLKSFIFAESFICLLFF